MWTLLVSLFSYTDITQKAIHIITFLIKHFNKTTYFIFTEPCKTVKYKLYKRYNLLNSGHRRLLLGMDSKDSLSKHGKKYKYLIVRYLTTDTVINETTLFINFSKFLSLLGGNLGLLLGLSCVTSIFIFYNYIGSSFAPWKRVKMQIWNHKQSYHFKTEQLTFKQTNTVSSYYFTKSYGNI